MEDQLNGYFPFGFLSEDYLKDDDFNAVVEACKAETTELEKALCAGNRIEQINKIFKEPKCLEHTIALAAVLDELGITRWRFLSSWLDKYDSGHAWIGAVLDDRMYFLDSANSIYIEYGIDFKEVQSY